MISFDCHDKLTKMVKNTNTDTNTKTQIQIQIFKNKYKYQLVVSQINLDVTASNLHPQCSGQAMQAKLHGRVLN